MQQGIFLDSVLQTISYFLDQHGEMIEKVRSDLERGLKNPATGRNGMTPSQVLRSLVLMRVKSWDLRELSERIADGSSSDKRHGLDLYGRRPEHAGNAAVLYSGPNGLAEGVLPRDPGREEIA